MKAKDLMTPNPIVMHKQDRIENVLDLMRKHNISKIPVVDDGRLVGIITDGEVLDELGAAKNRAISPTNLHVSGAMQRDFKTKTVGPETDLRAVIEMCKQEGVGMVPVVEGDHDGKLVGIITKADLLKLVVSTAPLRDIMKKQLHSVEPADRLIHARRLMMDHGIERLPVLDGGRVVGIVSEMDIALALDDFKKRHSPEHQKNQIKNLVVDDVMRRQVITAPPDLPANVAAQRMRTEDIGGLPVVTGDDHIAGMVTRTDLIRLIP
ncbi:MAG TPA: CBS domain-containing protein [Candidatus Thermoplasmatota archaeon]|jgi:CBS domain-containing protein|nr:CBS domain-containing protein [Candidatus Thermoplasmatota archaeon]